MPFPWKKTRVPRISKFVADLQSPKRGGSLVVETGFPTSLIDLFVKNRSRFRKHRSTKPPPPTDISDPPPPPPPPSPVTLRPPPRVPSLSHPLIGRNDDADPVTECSVNVVVLVKILMVLVLVASVKRLTVGITASAFTLLLLEYAGRFVVSCSVVESWFQKVLKKDRARVRRELTEFTELSSEGLSNDEIEVVEPASDVGIRCRDVASELIEEGNSNVLEPCPCDDVSECKIKGSRSGRFRFKMVKKFVPKKFRGSKKEKKGKHNEGESGSEVSSVVGEEKLAVLEIEEEEEEENGDHNKSSNTDEVDCGITCSYNEKRVDRAGSSSSSMVLVMIALLGLLFGLFPALILLMTWCCLVKIVRTLWRSHNVVPMLK